MFEVLGTIDASLARETMPSRIQLLEYVEDIIHFDIDTMLSNDSAEIQGYIALAFNCLEHRSETVDQSYVDDISEAASHGDEVASILEWIMIRADAEAVREETNHEALKSWVNHRDNVRSAELLEQTTDAQFIMNALEAVK